MLKYNGGWIEIIVGPMFSGKSAELITRAKTLSHANRPFVIFKPKIDNRWSSDKIVSRTGLQLKTHIITKSSQIKKYITPKVKWVLIDEIQFFDLKLVNVVNDLANSGIRVVLAGLDMNHKGQPFEVTSQIMGIAEFVTKLTAVCFKCGRAATFSRKLSGFKNKEIEIGNEIYEARCRKCYNKDIEK